MSVHLHHNSIITDAQHGFHKKSSCGTQLILIVEDLAGEIDKGGQTDMIRLDFLKAFDRLPDKCPLKLDFCGISVARPRDGLRTTFPPDPSRWQS